MHIVFDRCLCKILCAHEVLRCAAMRGVCVCVYLSRGGRISEVGGVLWHCKEGRILGFFHPSAYTMSPWMSRETKLSLWSISHFSWILFSSFEYALYSAMLYSWLVFGIGKPEEMSKGATTNGIDDRLDGEYGIACIKVNIIWMLV